MLSSEYISPTKNLTISAVVVVCFAVLWPKIFYPMIQSIIYPFDEPGNQNNINKLHFENLIHPQMRLAMGEARPLEKSIRDERREVHHPCLRQNIRPLSKGAGAVNFIIPVYAIGIILFFIYSLMKVSFKRQEEPLTSNDKASSFCPNILCARFYKKDELRSLKKEISLERKAQRALELYGKEKVLTALKTIILEMEDFRGKSYNQKLNAKLHKDYQKRPTNVHVSLKSS